MSTPPPPSGIMNTSVLYWDYTCIAFFGLSVFFFMVTAIYYAVKGFERVAGVAKIAFFAIFWMFAAAIVDAYSNGFTFTRPGDGVTVQWMRRALETFILPLLFLAFFKVMHNPSWEADMNHEEKSADMKKKNLHTVHYMSKWIICVVLFISQIALTLGYLDGNLALRWFTWVMSAVLAILGFIFTWIYAMNYGILHMSKKDGIHATKGIYPSKKKNGKSGRLWSIIFAWAFLLAGFITYYVINAVGSSTGYYISYDFEATSYMVIEIFWTFALVLLTYAAHVLQHPMKNQAAVRQQQSEE